MGPLDCTGCFMLFHIFLKAGSSPSSEALPNKNHKIFGGLCMSFAENRQSSQSHHCKGGVCTKQTKRIERNESL